MIPYDDITPVFQAYVACTSEWLEEHTGGKVAVGLESTTSILPDRFFLYQWLVDRVARDTDPESDKFDTLRQLLPPSSLTQDLLNYVTNFAYWQGIIDEKTHKEIGKYIREVMELQREPRPSDEQLNSMIESLKARTIPLEEVGTTDLTDDQIIHTINVHTLSIYSIRSEQEINNLNINEDDKQKLLGQFNKHRSEAISIYQAEDYIHSMFARVRQMIPQEARPAFDLVARVELLPWPEPLTDDVVSIFYEAGYISSDEMGEIIKRLSQLTAVESSVLTEAQEHRAELIRNLSEIPVCSQADIGFVDVSHALTLLEQSGVDTEIITQNRDPDQICGYLINYYLEQLIIAERVSEQPVFGGTPKTYIEGLVPSFDTLRRNTEGSENASLITEQLGAYGHREARVITDIYNHAMSGEQRQFSGVFSERLKKRMQEERLPIREIFYEPGFRVEATLKHEDDGRIIGPEEASTYQRRIQELYAEVATELGMIEYKGGLYFKEGIGRSFQPNCSIQHLNDGITFSYDVFAENITRLAHQYGLQLMVDQTQRRMQNHTRTDGEGGIPTRFLFYSDHDYSRHKDSNFAAVRSDTSHSDSTIDPRFQRVEMRLGAFDNNPNMYMAFLMMAFVETIEQLNPKLPKFECPADLWAEAENRGIIGDQHTRPHSSSLAAWLMPSSADTNPKLQEYMHAYLDRQNPRADPRDTRNVYKIAIPEGLSHSERYEHRKAEIGGMPLYYNDIEHAFAAMFAGGEKSGEGLTRRAGPMLAEVAAHHACEPPARQQDNPRTR